MSTAIEIEVDGPTNDCLRFRPLQRNLRGRFDWQRVGEPEAHRAAVQWGGVPIPGQIIGFDDAAGVGYVRDPLHDDEHAALRERIVRKGFKLPPEREEFPAIDEATFIFWMKKAVEAGLARVVQGKLPAKVTGEPRRNFILAPPAPSTSDKLAVAIADQTTAFRELTAAILKLVSK